MQSVEMYFNDTIAKHSLFKQAASLLIQEVPALTPIELQHRCADLTSMRRDISENSDQLFILMEFMGRGILDTTYIGEFQRALDASIHTCDSLYAKILVYKNSIIPCPE